MAVRSSAERPLNNWQQRSEPMSPVSLRSEEVRGEGIEDSVIRGERAVSRSKMPVIHGRLVIAIGLRLRWDVFFRSYLDSLSPPT